MLGSAGGTGGAQDSSAKVTIIITMTSDSCKYNVDSFTLGNEILPFSQVHTMIRQIFGFLMLPKPQILCLQAVPGWHPVQREPVPILVIASMASSLTWP